MTATDRLCILRFAASFLWADLSVDLAEHAFFLALAQELGVTSIPEIVALLATPPAPEHVDPTRVSLALAGRVRDVALRAIASDGRVLPREMELFDLLDELLPDRLRVGARSALVGLELDRHRRERASEGQRLSPDRADGSTRSDGGGSLPRNNT